MESAQNIKLRLQGVKNVGQITRAMEVVSATKMRKSQEAALRSRPYAHLALELLGKIAAGQGIESRFSQAREVKNTLLVIVTSDKGLAGSFNTQVLRKMDDFLKYDRPESLPDHNYKVLVVGKKGYAYAQRLRLQIVGTFYGSGDYISPEETQPIAEMITKGFVSGDWDRVVTASTHFRTTLKQDNLVRQILPLQITKIIETVRELVPEYGRYADTLEPREFTAERTEYLLEPSPTLILETLMPYLVKMQIYQLILEANASEHSARMVAMKNASENAAELASALQLSYNKVRQAGITRELIEIVSTQNALQ